MTAESGHMRSDIEDAFERGIISEEELAYWQKFEEVINRPQRRAAAEYLASLTLYPRAEKFTF